MSHNPSSLPPKKWFGVRPWLFVVLLGSIVFSGLITLFDLRHPTTTTDVPYEISKEALLPFTANLPSADRIEIESVSSTFENIDKVLTSKILVGAEATELVTLWRSLDYGYGNSIMCHEPGYRLRFYSNGVFITEATICFHCNNIYFYNHPETKTPADHLEAVFNLEDTKDKNTQGKKLRTYLSKLFPGHDPEAPSS